MIAGWVKYLNEIFNPIEDLDPNLIKALIASESGFRPILLADPNNPESARGLTQITGSTRVILGNGKGELKDY